MQTPSSAEMLERIDSELESEGSQQPGSGHSTDKLRDQILPAMEKSRDIQSYLYSYSPPQAQTAGRKVKNLLLGKVRNIVINVLERLTMRQQKFNELSYQAILELAREHQEMKQQIANLGER